MSTCVSCKHWQRSDGTYDPETWGCCEWVQDLSGGSLAKTTRIDGQPPEYWGAVTRDYEGYASSLTTHETFGCNHWQTNP